MTVMWHRIESCHTGSLPLGHTRAAAAETVLVSMGGCITSALTDWSVVEVVGAILGTVSNRTRRGVGAVATG
jgi:hypothetical protein